MNDQPKEFFDKDMYYVLASSADGDKILTWKFETTTEANDKFYVLCEDYVLNGVDTVPLCIIDPELKLVLNVSNFVDERRISALMNQLFSQYTTK